MAQTNLPRTGLTTFSAGSDPHPSRTKYNAEQTKLESAVVLYAQGAATARPIAGKRGILFWDESNNRLEYDNGTAWRELMSVGGGGVGTPVTFGTAVEGTSARAARADHSHRLTLATTTVHGGMSATDKKKLDDSTSDRTANTLVQRDAGGRAQFPDPSAIFDAANKTYVDTAVGRRALTEHNHYKLDATGGEGEARVYDGYFAYYRNKVGKFAVNDKGEIYLGTLAWSKITGKPTTYPASTHSHTWASITSKPSSFPATSHTHTALANGSAYLRLDSAGRVYGSHLWDRTYNNEPNMYLTSEGTIGRSTVNMAKQSHNHSADDITSGSLAYPRVRGTRGAHDYAVVASVPGVSYSVWVDGAGRFGRNTSAAKYKRNIRRANISPEAALSLVPRIYDRVGGPDGANEFGLIADEVQDHIPEIVIRDEKGQIDGLRYDLLAVALLSTVQQQQRDIAELKENVATLMGNVAP